MTVDDLREKNLIILECISGSKAYGLDTSTSDIDIKGVFLLPKETFYGLDYIPQVTNDSNDVVFYELGRFMELLSVNNPNILELLNTPDSAVLFRHPFLDIVKSELILSKLCKDTFGRFALSQIKKAKGLNKKIVNPVGEERKSLLSFCYVTHEQGSIPVDKFLEINKWNQEDCGLVNLPHMKNMFGLYHGKNLGYKGIIKNEHSNDISLSSIPKGEQQSGLLYCNLEGYSTYCKEYREYWDWVDKRNENRYENTMSHGKNYDAKNMMHVFRLLEMAIEIGKDHRVNVKRPNREFLLEIKSGKFKYEDLLKMADDRKQKMENIFENSTLPNTPDLEVINKLTFQLRQQFYDTCK
jgi:hypothetical protein